MWFLIMMNKIREDLPYDNKKWSPQAMKIFNNNREDYKKTVAIAKSLYSNRAFIVDDKSATIDGVARLHAMMYIQGTESAQLLMKCTTDNENKIKLKREIDVITAFYVPENIKWLKVIANGSCIGEFNGSPNEPELEEILRQSWLVPGSEDSHLEYILWLSQQGKIGFVHNQEKTIEIDGVNYNRLIFIQPMLPICMCMFAHIDIYTSDPCNVYLEVSICSDLRGKMMRSDQMVGWVEDCDEEIPIIIYRVGTVMRPYLSQIESVNDNVLEIDKIELPIFNSELIKSIDEPFENRSIM